MFDGNKILVISRFGIEGFSLLAKLASKYERIIWISSNPHLPHKILKKYSRDAELFGFYSQVGKTINPLNLNEVSLATHKASSDESCLVISCISELIMYHSVGKVYHLLLNVMKNTRRVIGMIVDGAQEKKDELLISTLFDSVFRIEKKISRNTWEVLLIPEMHIENKVYKLTYEDGVVELSELL